MRVVVAGVQRITSSAATIIVTLTKAEPLTFVRLCGMCVAVAGAATAARVPLSSSFHCCSLSRFAQGLL